ncbi:hypothetical protein JMUB7527_28540 [Staphylococcus aureus]
MSRGLGDVYKRQVLWEHIIQLKMPFFDKNESGQLMSRLTDDTKVINEFISQKLPNLLPSIVTLVAVSYTHLTLPTICSV